MGCGFSVDAVPLSQRLVVASPLGDAPHVPNPVTPDACVLKGQALLAQGRLEDALKELDGTIAKWPDHARARLERGNVAHAKQEWDAALLDFTAAILLQHNYLMAFFMRARVYMELRRYEEAMCDCVEAGALDPGNPQIFTLREEVRSARQAAHPNEEDAFADVETPKDLSLLQKLCMVCMETERGCRLRPCMHSALCMQCATSLKTRSYNCPICNSHIESIEAGAFMRTFASEDMSTMLAACGPLPSSPCCASPTGPPTTTHTTCTPATTTAAPPASDPCRKRNPRHTPAAPLPPSTWTLITAPSSHHSQGPHHSRPPDHSNASHHGDASHRGDASDPSHTSSHGNTAAVVHIAAEPTTPEHSSTSSSSQRATDIYFPLPLDVRVHASGAVQLAHPPFALLSQRSARLLSLQALELPPFAAATAAPTHASRASTSTEESASSTVDPASHPPQLAPPASPASEESPHHGPHTASHPLPQPAEPAPVSLSRDLHHAASHAELPLPTASSGSEAEMLSSELNTQHATVPPHSASSALPSESDQEAGSAPEYPRHHESDPHSSPATQSAVHLPDDTSPRSMPALEGSLGDGPRIPSQAE
ncbi:MAG: hypothetical protein WDW38_011209 [Sanguina aurantia]